MKSTIKLSPRIINPSQPRPIDVLIELTAPPAATIERAPIDAIVVIDRSGSMGGAPLEQVKAAVSALFRLIGADDRIGVVTFDNEVDVVLPLSKHDPVSAAWRTRRNRSSAQHSTMLRRSRPSRTAT